MNSIQGPSYGGWGGPGRPYLGALGCRQTRRSGWCGSCLRSRHPWTAPIRKRHWAGGVQWS